MQTITVQTSQNIEIEYDLAGVGDRIVAYLIDLLIYIAYYIIIFYLMSFAKGSGGYYYILIGIIPSSCTSYSVKFL
jgi:hypothetical protein